MKIISLTRITALLAGFLLLLACTRNDSSPREMEDQVSQNEKETAVEAVVEKAVEQIDREISMLENNNYDPASSKGEENEPCKPEIKIDKPSGSNFPKTITLDYGEGCLDANNNFRAGQVIVHITGPYWEENTVRQAKLADYVFNDIRIQGHRHEINKGKNEKGFYIFEVKQNEKAWNEKGELIAERKIERTRIYNRGTDLKTNSDDEVWVSGKANVRNNGRDVVKEITAPLYRNFGLCKEPYFQEGIIATYFEKKKIGELDYGDGSCDNKATWTNKEGKKSPVILGLWVNHYSVKP